MRSGEPVPTVLEGVAAAPGIAVGRARVLVPETLTIPERRLTPAEVPEEIARLQRAACSARERVQAIHHALAGVELADAIFRTQLLLLEDPQLLDGVARRIRDGGINAERALQDEGERMLAVFAAMPDPYLRERRSDLALAVRELQMCLLGLESARIGPLTEPTVLIAVDLSPTEIAQLDRASVLAFATDAGGPASHAVILAHSLGLPAVVGLGRATALVHEGDLVLVDGGAGRLWVRPSPEVVRTHCQRAARERQRTNALLRLADLPAETRDGRPIVLRANLERADEVERLRDHGATGVGLFRTEFLYLNRDEPPGEEEQLQHYRAVLAGVKPQPATIRTVDLGGDKLLVAGQRRSEANPALGLRGVRLARGRSPLSTVQLRALLRASPAGRLRILLPLVTGVEEVVAARTHLADLRRELEAEGHRVADGIELGVVVETPAAVALIDRLAAETDFFSIGTNDLIQYTLAVDRDNEAVAYLYGAGHPAVLRVLRSAVEGARVADRPIGVCGEMAGDPLFTLVLIGLGVDELSMSAGSVARVKRILRATDWAEARSLLAELLALRTAAEIGDTLGREMRRRFPEEFESAAAVP